MTLQIHHSLEGIQVFDVSIINIYDNEIHDITSPGIGEGITIVGSTGVTINHNIITGPFTTAGIYTSANMTGPISITNNTVTGASAIGIA